MTSRSALILVTPRPVHTWTKPRGYRLGEQRSQLLDEDLIFVEDAVPFRTLTLEQNRLELRRGPLLLVDNLGLHEARRRKIAIPSSPPAPKHRSFRLTPRAGAAPAAQRAQPAQPAKPGLIRRAAGAALGGAHQFAKGVAGATGDESSVARKAGQWVRANPKKSVAMAAGGLAAGIPGGAAAGAAGAVGGLALAGLGKLSGHLRKLRKAGEAAGLSGHEALTQAHGVLARSKATKELADKAGITPDELTQQIKDANKKPATAEQPAAAATEQPAAAATEQPAATSTDDTTSSATASGGRLDAPAAADAAAPAAAPGWNRTSGAEIGATAPPIADEPKKPGFFARFTKKGRAARASADAAAERPTAAQLRLQTLRDASQKVKSGAQDPAQTQAPSVTPEKIERARDAVAKADAAIFRHGRAAERIKAGIKDGGVQQGPVDPKMNPEQVGAAAGEAAKETLAQSNKAPPAPPTPEEATARIKRMQAIAQAGRKPAADDPFGAAPPTAAPDTAEQPEAAPPKIVIPGQPEPPVGPPQKLIFPGQPDPTQAATPQQIILPPGTKKRAAPPLPPPPPGTAGLANSAAAHASKVPQGSFKGEVPTAPPPPPPPPPPPEAPRPATQAGTPPAETAPTAELAGPPTGAVPATNAPKGDGGAADGDSDGTAPAGDGGGAKGTSTNTRPDGSTVTYDRSKSEVGAKPGPKPGGKTAASRVDSDINWGGGKLLLKPRSRHARLVENKIVVPGRTDSGDVPDGFVLPSKSYVESVDLDLFRDYRPRSGLKLLAV